MSHPKYTTIIVSSSFSGAGERKKIDYFENLDQSLRARGCRLLLLNTYSDPPDSSCDATFFPHFILNGHRFFSTSFMNSSGLSERTVEDARIRSDLMRVEIGRGIVDSLLVKAFLRDLLVETQPVLCVIWNGFLPMHRLFRGVCEESGVPVLYAEYGVLPGTIAFDSDGQMAESWVATQSRRFLELSYDDVLLATAAIFLERVRTGRRTRKDQRSEVEVRKVVEKYRGNAKAVIFYAGQNDNASGMRPSYLPSAKIHSPYFTSTGDALDHLSVVAKRNDWLVIFKPHPMCESEAEAYSIRERGRVVALAGANVFDCIEASDATVTILSQVSYLALIHSKPCVLLGRLQLSGKGCLYEINSRENTENTIKQAINDGFSNHQREIWHRHVAQLLRHYLFGFDADIVALTGRDEHIAADFLLDHARADTSNIAAARWGGDISEKIRLRRLRCFYLVSRFLEAPLRTTLKLLPKSVLSGLKRILRL